MKLSSNVIANISTAIAGIAVALYNIEYVFTASYPKNGWDYLQNFGMISFISYLGITVLVIWPTSLLFAWLYKCADDRDYPFDKPSTLHYEFIQLVVSISVLVITALFWFSGTGIEIPRSSNMH